MKTKRFTSRRLAALLVGGAAALSAGAAAPAADAATLCRQVLVLGVDYGQACVTADAAANESGTTVAPRVTFSCTQTLARIAQVDLSRCGVGTVGTGANQTGFVPRIVTPGVYVEQNTGTVRIRYGLLGTLWVNGASTNVYIGETCVGDPAIC